jgi:hypothetical protein
VVRAEYAASLGQSLSLHYTQANAPLVAAIRPLSTRPAVPVAGLSTETTTVSGHPVVLVHGSTGPVLPLVGGGSVSAAALAHQLTAVFEDGPLSVIITVDDRSTEVPALLAFVGAWLAAPR